LDVLRETTEAASDSEVVRKALTYFAQLVDDTLDGNEIVIRYADGRETEVPMAALDAGPAEGPRDVLVKRNLVLHERTAERLDFLKRVTGAPSDSELVRSALQVYDLLIENALAGRRLIIRNVVTKAEQEVRFPVFVPRTGTPGRLNLWKRLKKVA
jgi:hypothetical protein